MGLPITLRRLLLLPLCALPAACQAPAADAAPVQENPGLTMRFDQVPSMAMLESLAASQQVRSLIIWDDGEGFANAATGPATRLNDEHLAVIARIASLESLTIGGWDVDYTDRGLAALQALPELRSLKLTQAQGITDDGMAYVADFPQLRTLDLTYTNIGEVGLAHLLAAPHLQDVSFGWAREAERSLARFQDAHPETPFLRP